MKTVAIIGLLGVLVADLALAQTRNEKRRTKKPRPTPSSAETPITAPGSADTTEEPPPASSTESSSDLDSQPTKTSTAPKKSGGDKPSVDANLKGPTWMYDLGLTATPGVWFENNKFNSVVSIGQGSGDYESKESDGDLKLKMKIQAADLSLDFAAKTPSKKIAYGFALGASRSQVDVDGGVATIKVKNSTKTDSPDFSAFVSTQVRPGIWVGYATSWKTNFKKAEQKISSDGATVSDTTSTSRFESSANAVAIEVISPTSHAGVEISIENDDEDTSKSVGLPFRFSVSDTLFTGFTLTSKDETDFDSGKKSSASSVEVEVGQQFSSSAYLVSYEYLLGKSSSLTSNSISKEKTLSSAFTFGPPKGMRFGVALGYSDQRETESGTTKSVFKTPYIAFLIGRSN